MQTEYRRRAEVMGVEEMEIDRFNKEITQKREKMGRKNDFSKKITKEGKKYAKFIKIPQMP